MRFDDGITTLTRQQWRRRDARRRASLRRKPNPFDGLDEQAEIDELEKGYVHGSCRRIRCVERPELRFPSLRAAAMWCGVSRSNFCHQVRRHGSVGGLHFEYAT